MFHWIPLNTLQFLENKDGGEKIEKMFIDFMKNDYTTKQVVFMIRHTKETYKVFEENSFLRMNQHFCDKITGFLVVK